MGSQREEQHYSHFNGLSKKDHLLSKGFLQWTLYFELDLSPQGTNSPINNPEHLHSFPKNTKNTMRAAVDQHLILVINSSTFKSPLIENPTNGHINPYYWDDHTGCKHWEFRPQHTSQNLHHFLVGGFNPLEKYYSSQIFPIKVWK